MNEQDFIERVNRRLAEERGVELEKGQRIIKQGKLPSEKPEDNVVKTTKRQQPSKPTKTKTSKSRSSKLPKSLQRGLSKLSKSFGYSKKLSSSLLNIGAGVSSQKRVFKNSSRRQTLPRGRRLPIQPRQRFSPVSNSRAFSRRDNIQQRLKQNQLQQNIQQFQKPRALGVWAKNENSAIGSKMPKTNKIWHTQWRTNPDGSPKVFLEGDLMGNIKEKTYGGADAFFN